MVAKCANPACNREFQELSKGRLFLISCAIAPKGDGSNGRRKISVLFITTSVTPLTAMMSMR